MRCWRVKRTVRLRNFINFVCICIPCHAPNAKCSTILLQLELFLTSHRNARRKHHTYEILPTNGIHSNRPIPFASITTVAASSVFYAETMLRILIFRIHNTGHGIFSDFYGLTLNNALWGYAMARKALSVSPTHNTPPSTTFFSGSPLCSTAMADSSNHLVGSSTFWLLQCDSALVLLQRLTHLST